MSRTASVRFGALLAVAVVAGTAGCPGGPAAPRTYPVTGQVIFKGGAPLTGGEVEFQSTKDPSLLTRGAIQPDGRFTLATVVNDRMFPGAVEGPHRVKILPPQREDQSVEQVRLLRSEYTVDPRENHFVIEIEKGREP